MYNKSFYIKDAIWNNAFSYKDRTNKEIYIPSLLKIQDFDEIKISNKIAFEDFDFDWKLSSNFWLKNFYKIKWEKKDLYLFDNHNHAYYFWYLARKNQIIFDECVLYHIDEHSDLRDPKKYLLKPDSFDLNKVFDYTNNFLNVWNYIIPAKKEWLIKNIIQIRNQTNIEDYFKLKNDYKTNIILNLDLDFFHPNLDYIDFDLKKKVILDIASKASFITISSSPFFINQKLNSF